MAKKRKIKIGRLLLVVFLILIILFAFLFCFYIKEKRKRDAYVFDKDKLKINEVDYSEMKELDLDLYSKEYMVIRLNDLKVLYGKDIDKRIYPASLTKIVTLDTVVSNVNNMSDTSYFTQQDYYELIEEDASMAYLKINKEYSISDLLYALVLPSGADAGRALENYLAKNGKDLIDEMNNLADSLGMENSHFTNSAGLHNDNLYTTLNDYTKLIINCLQKDDCKKVLKTFEATLSSGEYVKSTLIALSQRDDDAMVYGGKTGFTEEAGENIMVLFSKNNRSYLMVLANADGNPYKNQPYHINDANKIISLF